MQSSIAVADRNEQRREDIDTSRLGKNDGISLI